MVGRSATAAVPLARGRQLRFIVGPPGDATSLQRDVVAATCSSASRPLRRIATCVYREVDVAAEAAAL